LFDFKPKPLKCSGDQIPSGGHSGKKRVETIRLLPLIPISMRWLSAFFAMTGKWNLSSGKSRWFWSWGQKIVANLARQHTGAVYGFWIGRKRRSLGTNHQTKGTFQYHPNGFISFMAF
jgi:hypothetical protein